MKRKFTPFAFAGFFVIGLLLASCSSDQQQADAGKNNAATPKSIPAGQASSTGSVAGVNWSVPAGWSKTPDKPMRAATYQYITDEGVVECAVFYFGAGQGGDVEANIQRWISQVKQADGSESQEMAKRSEVKSPCCSISTIEVAGTYMASSGPMMQATSEKPGYVLLGGIVPAPEGNVFFKLTGPAKMVEKVRSDFLAMLQSVSSKSS